MLNRKHCKYNIMSENTLYKGLGSHMKVLTELQSLRSHTAICEVHGGGKQGSWGQGSQSVSDMTGHLLQARPSAKCWRQNAELKRALLGRRGRQTIRQLKFKRESFLNQMQIVKLLNHK